MCKYSLISLWLIICSHFMVAQTIDSSKILNNTSGKHKWSVQFSIGENFTIKSLDGLMFSLKYDFNQNYSFRFGVGTLEQFANGVEYNSYYGSSEINRNKQNYFMGGSFLVYPHPGKIFTFYFGGGPLISYSHKLFSENSYTTSWAAGLQFNFGAEWFAMSRLSLFAEYHCYGTYGKTSSKSYECGSAGCGNVITTSTDWYFNGTTARLGISFYL